MLEASLLRALTQSGEVVRGVFLWQRQTCSAVTHEDVAVSVGAHSRAKLCSVLWCGVVHFRE